MNKTLICACGCKKDIVILPHHKYRGIPKYLLGHNQRDQSIAIGQKYNRLTLKKFHHKHITQGYFWECECECGNAVIVKGHAVKSGRTKSCGCLQKEKISILNYKHGMAKKNRLTPTYRCWGGMIQRTTNPNNDRYSDYGGRGITTCARWTTFKNFLFDMGERPKGMSIERINNDKGYSPENCKWATPNEQQNNRRVNHLIEYNGEKKTLTQWSCFLGISFDVLRTRLRRHWSLEKAFWAPVQHKTAKHEPIRKKEITG